MGTKETFFGTLNIDMINHPNGYDPCIYLDEETEKDIKQNLMSNKGRFIIILLNITYLDFMSRPISKLSELFVGGHANVIIIDKKLKTIERFDPGVDLDTLNLSNERESQIIENLDHQLESLFVDGKYLTKYISLSRVLYKNFQTLQVEEKLLPDEEEGFCLAWSAWYADRRLKFPDTSPENLLNNMMTEMLEYQKNGHTLTDFIRGYGTMIINLDRRFHIINNFDVVKSKKIIDDTIKGYV